jgi:chemotaxis protein methyltransferase CheR
VELSDSSARLLAGLLEARTGQSLAISRRWRIEATLGALIRGRGLASVEQLVSTILGGSDPGLPDEVVEALLNNETFFFRDRAVFDLLLGSALDRIAAARAETRRLSIWCAGCSTGQEAYSIAMAFAEQPERWAGWSVSILATDVSRAALDQARSGLYSQFEVQRGLPVRQMMRWFAEEPPGGWRIDPALRRAIRFQVHNLLEPAPPPGRFDIILCRNVLLYFAEAARRRAFDALAAAAAPDAALVLGAGETVTGQTGAFVSDPDCRGLYCRSAPASAVRAA